MRHQVEARYRSGSAGNPTLLSTVEDVDALVDELLSGPEDENLAQMHSRERDLLPTGAFDHELLVGVDRSLQVGLLAYMDAEGNFITLGSSDSRTDPVYWIMGHRREFFGNLEIPVEVIRSAVKEFLLSGGQRPTGVEWQVPEYW